MIIKVFFSLFLTTAIALAAPKPFGLTIGTTGVKEAKRIFKDLKTLKEFRIYPQTLGWLIRIKYIFPKYIQDRFITLGSNIG